MQHPSSSTCEGKNQVWGLWKNLSKQTALTKLFKSQFDLNIGLIIHIKETSYWDSVTSGRDLHNDASMHMQIVQCIMNASMHMHELHIPSKFIAPRDCNACTSYSSKIYSSKSNATSK